jgi:hypothetical protein
MWNPFDILKKLPDGGIVWIEAAKDLETARERIKLFATCKPGEYVIFCQKTQAVIAMPWVTYPRQEVEAKDSPRQVKKKAKKKAPGRPSQEPNANRIVAEIIDDVGRIIGGKK